MEVGELIGSEQCTLETRIEKPVSMAEGKTTEFSQMDLPPPKPSVGARIKAHFKKWWWVHAIIVVVVVLVVVLPVYVDIDITQTYAAKRGRY